jgi:hypothetical protein
MFAINHGMGGKNSDGMCPTKVNRDNGQGKLLQLIKRPYKNKLRGP